MTTQTSGPPERLGGGRASIQFACPRCETEFHCAARSDGPLPVACPSCRWDFTGPKGLATRAQDETPQLNVDEPVGRCWVCGNEEFYIQKDFNRQLGFLIIVTSFLLVFLVMLLVDHLVGLYFLFGLAVIDCMAYYALRNVTVCYLCHSIYRGFPQHSDHKGFYLGLEEKHKHLRQEWLAQMVESEGGTEAGRPLPGGSASSGEVVA